MTDLRKMVKIETHENVTIEYETANVGSRMLAYLIDMAILYGTIIIGAICTIILVIAEVITWFDGDIWDADTDVVTIVTIYILVLFLLQYFYFIFFELVTKGRSPGKIAMKLRVVSVTGEPETFLMSVVRNFFRIADELPAGNFIGGVLVFFGKKSQRLGDKIANTMVIKDTNVKKFTKYIDELIAESEQEAFEAEKASSYDGIVTIDELEEQFMDNDFAAEKEFLNEYMKRRKFYKEREQEKYDAHMIKQFSKKICANSDISYFRMTKNQMSELITALSTCDADFDAVVAVFCAHASPVKEEGYYG